MSDKTYKNHVTTVFFCAALLMFMMTSFFVTPTLTLDQKDQMIFLRALLGALMSAYWIGRMNLRFVPAQGRNLVTSATGGFAVFLLLLFIQRPYVAPEVAEGEAPRRHVFGKP